MILATLLSLFSLLVTPPFQHGRWSEVTYTARIPSPGRVCTGWAYPVTQWHQDQWPSRRSCRDSSQTLFQERWGGPHYPFPFNGEYEAFLEHAGKRLTTRFRVLESGSDR